MTPSRRFRAFGVWIGAVLAIWVGSPGSTTWAGVVFSQPVLGDTVSFTSNIIGALGDQVIAENVDLPDSATIDGLRWWGSYSRVPLDGPAPVDSFVLAFYGGLNGAPPLAMVNLPAASVVRTPTSNPGLVDFTGIQSIFQYETTLANPVNLPAGTSYVSLINHTVPVWGWVGHNSTDDLYFQVGNSNFLSASLGDRALELMGSFAGPPGPAGGPGPGIGLAEAPEPSSLVLTGLAAAAAATLAVRRRWTKARSQV